MNSVKAIQKELGQTRAKKAKTIRATKVTGNTKMANGLIMRLEKLGKEETRIRTQEMKRIGTGAIKKTGLNGVRRMIIQLLLQHHS